MGPAVITLQENYPWHPVFLSCPQMGAIRVLCSSWGGAGHQGAPRALPGHHQAAWRLRPAVPPPPGAGSYGDSSWGCSICCCKGCPHTLPNPPHAPQTLLSTLFCRGLNVPHRRTYQKPGILSVQSKCGESKNYLISYSQVRKAIQCSREEILPTLPAVCSPEFERSLRTH